MLLTTTGTAAAAPTAKPSVVTATLMAAEVAVDVIDEDSIPSTWTAPALVIVLLPTIACAESLTDVVATAAPRAIATAPLPTDTDRLAATGVTTIDAWSVALTVAELT